MRAFVKRHLNHHFALASIGDVRDGPTMAQARQPSLKADLISLRELSRRLNVPEVRIRRLITAGLLEPDIRSNSSTLFLSARVPALRLDPVLRQLPK